MSSGGSLTSPDSHKMYWIGSSALISSSIFDKWDSSRMEYVFKSLSSCSNMSRDILQGELDFFITSCYWQFLKFNLFPRTESSLPPSLKRASFVYVLCIAQSNEMCVPSLVSMYLSERTKGAGYLNPDQVTNMIWLIR